MFNKNSLNETFNITFGKSQNKRIVKNSQNEFYVKVVYKEREKFMPERGTLNIDKANNLLDINQQLIDEGYIKYINGIIILRKTKNR